MEDDLRRTKARASLNVPVSGEDKETGSVDGGGCRGGSTPLGSDCRPPHVLFELPLPSCESKIFRIYAHTKHHP